MLDGRENFRRRFLEDRAAGDLADLADQEIALRTAHRVHARVARQDEHVDDAVLAEQPEKQEDERRNAGPDGGVQTVIDRTGVRLDRGLAPVGASAGRAECRRKEGGERHEAEQIPRHETPDRLRCMR